MVFDPPLNLGYSIVPVEYFILLSLRPLFSPYPLVFIPMVLRWWLVGVKLWHWHFWCLFRDPMLLVLVMGPVWVVVVFLLVVRETSSLHLNLVLVLVEIIVVVVVV